MKNRIFKYIILLLLPLSFYGQKYVTKSGVVKFEASMPAFEEVAAENKTTSAILNADTGEIAALALMKGFRFKIALMEEHFNESYAETDKYPKAAFKGKLEGFNPESLTAEPKKFTITGDLTIHGKTKKINDTAMVTKSGNTITVTGDFVVNPVEFGIEVPNVVRKKVSEKVKVSFSFSLDK